MISPVVLQLDPAAIRDTIDVQRQMPSSQSVLNLMPCPGRHCWFLVLLMNKAIAKVVRKMGHVGWLDRIQLRGRLV